MKRILIALLTASFTLALAQSVDANKYVELYKSLASVPLVTAGNPDLSYEEAYLFQEAYVQAFLNSGEELAGYKLGLTGEKRPFGATEAVYGRLFKSQFREAGKVYSSDFVKPLVEVELAFKFKKDVDFPLTFGQLKDAIDWVAPAIELPDLVFDDMKNLSWLDLIALDVAPRQVIIGNHVSINDVDVESINITAYLNGEVVKQAPSTSTLGGQMRALMFLAAKLNNHMISFSKINSPLYKIKAGDVVITGALGGFIPGKPGQYQVNYGPLGNLDFEIVSTGK